MSEEIVSIRYSTLPNWVRVVAAISCLIVIINVVGILHKMRLDLPEVLFGMALLIFFMVLLLCLLYYADNTRIKFLKNTIRFPYNLSPQLKFKLERDWSDIGCVQSETIYLKDASSVENWNYGVTLIFNSSGEAVHINLPNLTKKDRELLIVNLINKVNAAKLSPKLHDLYGQVKQSSTSNLPTPTHTNLWEEEMSSKFALNCYGTLQEGSLLQNNRYRIISMLSSGNMSAVYLTMDKTDEKIVVLKESFFPDYINAEKSAKMKELLHREAMILSKLAHPNICKVRDFFSEQSREFLVLEYIPGTSLKTHILTNGKMDASTVISYAHTVTEILNYLHSQSPPIVHRDITPDNLIINETGDLALIDFGAANELLGLATGTLIGKQSYIAPEQFRGKAEPRSDIYSLGCTMHFLLTGEEPEALSSSNPASINANTPEQLNQIVISCTSQNPDERPASAKVLSDTLSHLRTKTLTTESSHHE